MGPLHNEEVEEAVTALVAFWEGEPPKGRMLSVDIVLLTVLAWIMEEWGPAEA